MSRSSSAGLTVALSAALAAACGGGGRPTAPPTPTPVEVRAFDGWTGQPVAAAVSPSSPMPGATVTTQASGYLPRIQTAARELFLWPEEEAYVRALVYTEFSPGRLLARWTRAFTVRPLPGHEQETATALAVAGAATGLSLTSSAAGEVEFVIDPEALNALSPTALAATWRQFSGSTVASCRIAVRRDGWVTQGIILHELGHCLGLGHSPSETDLMFRAERRATQSFTERELVQLRMMYAHRQPGNAAPDTAPGTRAAGAARNIVVVD